MHGFIDGSATLLAVTRGTLGLLSCWNMAIFDSNERCSTCRCILLPDFQMLGSLFLLLFALFLSFSRDEHLLIVGWSEWRSSSAIASGQKSILCVLVNVYHLVFQLLLFSLFLDESKLNISIN